MIPDYAACCSGSLRSLEYFLELKVTVAAWFHFRHLFRPSFKSFCLNSFVELLSLLED
jgi:hypothetical protein